jgi:hypothetical protein
VSATSAIDLAEGLQSSLLVSNVHYLVFVWSGSLLTVLLFFFMRWTSKPREKVPKRVTPPVSAAEPEIELPAPPPPTKADLMKQETTRHEETMEAINYAKLGDIEREIAEREECETHQIAVKRILKQ